MPPAQWSGSRCHKLRHPAVEAPFPLLAAQSSFDLVFSFFYDVTHPFGASQLCSLDFIHFQNLLESSMDHLERITRGLSVAANSSVRLQLLSKSKKKEDDADHKLEPSQGKY